LTELTRAISLQRRRRERITLHQNYKSSAKRSAIEAQRTPQREAVPSLTGIRGIAAVWVLLFHLGGTCASLFGFAWLADVPIVATGWSGVDMFFVLSGFVLMRAHSTEFIRLSTSSILRFAKVRIARVYPVSAVVLMLIALLAIDHGFVTWYRLQHPGNVTPIAFIKTALLATRWFLPGPRGEWNQPVWSLSAEILGYAAFPLLAWLLARRSWLAALAVALASLGTLMLYQLTAHVDLDDMGQRPAVIRMACCFIAGAALARACVVAPPRVANSSARLTVIATALILASCMAPRIAVILPFSYAILILALAFRHGPIDRALSAPFVQFLGRISFPLYLLHVMPLLWLGYRLQSGHVAAVLSIAALLLYVALIIGLAALLHVAVERPSHRWGRRWGRPAAILPCNSAPAAVPEPP
jgi:peptidoglycan/LPS O-acetylase OafA/YrhL